MRYGVCKNKYGLYKIQRYYLSSKVFFIFKISGGWRDSCFEPMSSTCIKFKTRGEAEDQIQEFLRDENNSWECDGEY